MKWMIYGANGYTGELIAREAARRQMTPILAGRSHSAISTLADELELSYRVFALDERLHERLDDVHLVLHCAGPFSATAKPMIEACLATNTHYLDITGEIDIFEYAQSLSQQASTAGIVLCPGVGFDVIPTDCVAASLASHMPDATHLALGFDSRSGLSQGTAKTSVEGLAGGGRIREGGQLRRVPLAFKTRTINFGNGDKLAMTIPWGDVATAFYTTGIPNIETFIPASPKLVQRLKRLNLVRPLLGLGPVQGILKRQVEKRITGPGEQERSKTSTYVWGEARNADTAITARMRTANGYDVTVHGSLGVVVHLLGAPDVAGAQTPARLMGASYAETLPGSGAIEFD
ncbi:MAG: saccharopine dehydrogenase NADP-binding domain-containing protein [Gammaproteobacteria bacterium]|nr:saccharopine dehydrogenase NADP-binding domain-containing protein [Gammaproteobacteria bacterium]NND61005.1 hypothetical protein [Gammaproteobacteria bacterium]